MRATPTRSEAAGRNMAWWLALAGCLPFLAFGAALAWYGKSAAITPLLTDAFKTWSALALSFLAGIRWGMALKEKPPSPLRLALSVLPAGAAWLTLPLPDPIAIATLMVLFCAQGAWDSLSVHDGLAPAWIGPLRMLTTLVIVAAHGLAFVAVY